MPTNLRAGPAWQAGRALLPRLPRAQIPLFLPFRTPATRERANNQQEVFIILWLTKLQLTNRIFNNRMRAVYIFLLTPSLLGSARYINARVTPIMAFMH